MTIPDQWILGFDVHCREQLSVRTRLYLETGGTVCYTYSKYEQPNGNQTCTKDGNRKSILRDNDRFSVRAEPAVFDRALNGEDDSSTTDENTDHYAQERQRADSQVPMSVLLECDRVGYEEEIRHAVDETLVKRDELQNGLGTKEDWTKHGLLKARNRNCISLRMSILTETSDQVYSHHVLKRRNLSVILRFCFRVPVLACLCSLLAQK